MKLREEYEATRVIADQLVNANVLDDVLGLFGEDAAAGDELAGAARPVDIEALLQPYLSEDEVSGAAIFAKSGERLAGPPPFVPDVTSALLDALRTSAEHGAAALGQASPRLATLEYEGGVVVAAWPTPDHTLLITLRSSSDLSLLTHRLRRDLEALAAALSGAHGGAAHGGPSHGGSAHA